MNQYSKHTTWAGIVQKKNKPVIPPTLSTCIECRVPQISTTPHMKKPMISPYQCIFCRSCIIQCGSLRQYQAAKKGDFNWEFPPHLSRYVDIDLFMDEKEARKLRSGTEVANLLAIV